jgi:hypothetical protein
LVTDQQVEKHTLFPITDMNNDIDVQTTVRVPPLKYLIDAVSYQQAIREVLSSQLSSIQ